MFPLTVLLLYRATSDSRRRREGDRAHPGLTSRFSHVGVREESDWLRSVQRLGFSNRFLRTVQFKESIPQMFYFEDFQYVKCYGPLDVISLLQEIRVNIVSCVKTQFLHHDSLAIGLRPTTSFSIINVSQHFYFLKKAYFFELLRHLSDFHKTLPRISPD